MTMFAPFAHAETLPYRLLTQLAQMTDTYLAVHPDSSQQVHQPPPASLAALDSKSHAAVGILPASPSNGSNGHGHGEAKAANGSSSSSSSISSTGASLAKDLLHDPLHATTIAKQQATVLAKKLKASVHHTIGALDNIFSGSCPGQRIDFVLGQAAYVLLPLRLLPFTDSFARRAIDAARAAAGCCARRCRK